MGSWEDTNQYTSQFIIARWLRGSYGPYGGLARNNLVFKNREATSEEIICKATVAVWEWLTEQSISTLVSHQTQP